MDTRDQSGSRLPTASQESLPSGTFVRRRLRSVTKSAVTRLIQGCQEAGLKIKGVEHYYKEGKISVVFETPSTGQTTELDEWLKRPHARKVEGD